MFYFTCSVHISERKTHLEENFCEENVAKVACHTLEGEAAVREVTISGTIAAVLETHLKSSKNPILKRQRKALRY